MRQALGRLRSIICLAAAPTLGLALLTAGCQNEPKTSDNDIDYVGTGDAMELMRGGKSVLGIGGNDVGAWVDPRSEADYIEGHIPGAIHLPFARVAQEHAALKKYDFVVVYGESYNDPFAKAMSKRLIELGIDSVYVLEGGLQAWVSAGNTIDTGPVDSEARAQED